MLGKTYLNQGKVSDARSQFSKSGYARSVAAAEAAAKSTTSVMDEQPSRPKPKPGVFDMVPESEGGVAPDSPSQSAGQDTPAIGGPQAPGPGQPSGFDQAADQRSGEGAYPVDGGDQPRR